MSVSSVASCIAGGSVKTNTRRYQDANNTAHEVVFRSIDHGQGVKIYDVILDGVLIPRLDYGLYNKLSNMCDTSLARYFTPAD